MASPFRSTVPQVIKIEDEGNSSQFGQEQGEQELMDMFRKGVRRRLELRKKQGQYNTSGSANPAPPPPVHQQPPPPPPPPAPVHHTWAKRSAADQPPGFAGVRQPPPKQYQRKPPRERAQHSRQPAPDAHGTAAPSGQPPVNIQWEQNAPQPVPNAHRAPFPPRPPPVNASSGVPPANTVKPPLQRRSEPKPKPTHAAAKKRPTVPCVFCGVLCMTAWHLKQHEQGRKHRNKVAYLAGEMNVQCNVCNVHLSSGLNVEEHYTGKQHLWRLHGGA